MATLRKYGGKYNSTFCQLCGLSTDTKPTSVLINDRSVGLADGSEFIEMDTNKKYRYSADNAIWYEVENGGGGGGSATLIDKTITANGTYDAVNDGADGYKSVDVDVSASFSKISVSAGSNKICIINPSDNYGGHVTINDEDGVSYFITKPVTSLYFTSQNFTYNKWFSVSCVIGTNNPTIKYIRQYGDDATVNDIQGGMVAYEADGTFSMEFADEQAGAGLWYLRCVGRSKSATPFTFDME